MGMTSEEMVKLCRQHTMYTWARQDAVNPLPVERAEGVYMYTPDGKRVIDFNSQLMCVNVGHGNPRVLDAMKRQMEDFTYVYPGTATAVRARVGKMLAELTPGNINRFFFTVGGADANEERDPCRPDVLRPLQGARALSQLPRGDEPLHAADG